MKITPSKITMWSRLGACGAYGQAMMEIPEINPNAVALTADLCFYSGLDRYSKKFPDNFYNVGIAEQNLVGIAGGLAKEGFNTFVSTYASFATTRALDQVRVNMGYMNLPIKLVGLTSGLSVGILGATHMSIEDVAIMRSIPNVTIIQPADCTEVVKATLALANYNHPVYLRLTGPMNNPIVYKEDYDFEIGKAVQLKKGRDIGIISTGTMVAKSLEVAERLESDGISVSVINMHTIKPIDCEAIDKLKECRMIVTIEEHSKIGGLGGAVAEYICDKKFPPLMILGLDDQFMHAAAYDYLIEKSRLTSEEIYKKISDKIGK